MQFDLTESFLAAIGFAMQDHDLPSVIDCEQQRIIAASDRTSEGNLADQYQNLPSWTSADVFELMTTFVDDLRHPLAAADLRRVLVSGRGVFKQFKATIKQYPNLERQWFRFKDQHIERLIRQWYNDLREVWGLDRLPLEPDTETDDLILSDFVIVKAEPAPWPELRALDSDLPSIGLEPGLVYLARTAGNELVGFCWASFGAAASPAKVQRLFVAPEYRGLGLGGWLFRATVADLTEYGVIEITIPANGQFFGRTVAAHGFEPAVTVWRRQ